MADTKKKSKTIPLSGKYMTHEPSTIGSNFQTLTNMRYEDTHPKGIAGNTKINTTALTTYLKTKSAYHFRKSQPAESHLLVQAYNSGATASQILENTTAIPSAGDYSATALWTDTSGAVVGSFCDAPDGQVIYANGVDTCMWGGDEMRVGAVITSTAVVGDDGSTTNPKDITEIMQNTKTDSENITHIGGGIDSYTVLMLHMNGTDGSTTFTDDSDSAHAMTAVGNAQIDTASKQFGTGSGLFDGTGDYLTALDSDDWTFGADPWTIDFWVKPDKVTGLQGICGQYLDADNYWEVYFNAQFIIFAFKKAGSVLANYSTTSVILNNTWQHIEIARNGTDFYIFLNGVSQTLNVGTAIGTSVMSNWGAGLEVGAGRNHAEVLDGRLDEFRISKGVARHTANFTVSAAPYMPTWKYFLVGSPRPLQGLKFYVSYPNSAASTMTGSCWDGSTFSSLTLTDNTDTGATLAQTGTVTFSSTVDTAKPRYLEGYFLYWYQFYVDAGEASIYQITLDAPFQPIVDLWDGVFRDVAAFYVRILYFWNQTLKVLRSDYDAATADTYADLSSLPAYSDPDNCLEIGFPEKMTGLYFEIPPQYNNTTADTTMSVDYWNGTQYVTVGEIADGTSSADVSFATSGIVTWSNINLADETKVNKTNSVDKTIISDNGNINKTTPYYFYRVRFDKQLRNAMRLDYVGGITSPIELSHYKFPVFAQGRVLLGCDTSGKKNEVLCSAKWMPQVYNGQDTAKIYLGDEQELNCGIEVFSQYGGNLYSMILMFKDTETWVIAGQDIEAWKDNIFPISKSIGCPAPQTLKSITLPQEPSIGINRSLCIWQGANGVYMSDGRAPIPIHHDIKEYFDKNDSRCITASLVGNSVGFIDHEKLEYHWLFASGTSATSLNKELVYDIKRGKWFEIDRGTGMYLQCGCDVQDTNGNQYTYGFIDTGYTERLEYGTTFDGGDITCTFQTGDYLPDDTIMQETMLDKVKLLAVAKTTTTNNIAVTHYGDTQTTGTTLKDCFDPNNTGYRLAYPFNTDNLGGYTFHSLKFAMTTDDETIPFEPLALGIVFHDMRES